MDKKQFEEYVKKASFSGLECKAYPNNYLLNVTDTDGVIQSYYCSTGTAIFRDVNNKYRSNKHTEHDMKIERFLALCSGKEDILETFFGG